MKKIFKKTLSLMLCIAFSGMQMSLAGVSTLSDGAFAGKDVLGGSGAKINGHTSGLTGVTTDADLKNATLQFSKNTRIDWTKLNVDKGQTLNFKNGNFGVLNNVLGTSISKFAGTITAENGKIVISNPNGMMFSSGHFTGGALVLTTKDLKAMGATDAEIDALFDAALNDKIKAVENGDNFGLIVLGGSTITSPDINIISNGAFIQATTLASPNQGGVVLVSADGANFVAQPYTMGTKTINMSSTGPLVMAGGAVTTQGGKAILLWLVIELCYITVQKSMVT